MIVVLMAQSKNFRNFIKLILALLPKHHFILMTCSTIMKMYKKSSILRVGQCMSSKLNSIGCRSLWGIPCPSWCTDVFALVNIKFLSVQDL
jgi:hypothetical protein